MKKKSPIDIIIAFKRHLIEFLKKMIRLMLIMIIDRTKVVRKDMRIEQ